MIRNTETRERMAYAALSLIAPIGFAAAILLGSTAHAVPAITPSMSHGTIVPATLDQPASPDEPMAAFGQ